MRRKYDIRNKRTFIIILILSLIIIGIFSLFIYKYKHTEKIQYLLNTGSIIQDNNKNYLELEEDATLKVRWNGNYYLEYQGNKISLGKKVIVYDTISKGIRLYGKFYEISENGKIIENTDETKLNSSDSIFYKLDDREYLLIDKEITSEDKSVNASNYLLVELDRMGNAKLSNYKLNLKTIKPTTLITNRYRFDIANEMLKYNTLEIDLKKIIGTTNEYKEEKKEDKKEETNNSNNTSDIASDNQAVANGTGNDSGIINNGANNGEYVSVKELKKNAKMTAIVNVAVAINKIDFDYVVYDPYNEYKSISADIIEENTSRTVQISRNDTHISFDDLKANTKYEINFYYTTIDSDTNQEKVTSFGDFEIKTKMPQYSIAVTKVSRIYNNVEFKVYLQEGYQIEHVMVTPTIINGDNYQVLDQLVLDVNALDKVVKGNFSIAGYDIDSNTSILLNIDSVSGPNGILDDINSYITFRIVR